MTMSKVSDVQLKKLLRKNLNENFSQFTMFERQEIIQDVLDRVGEYGMDYVKALAELNMNFPSTKYKRG
jgi:lauroyl/myristoyl acyltransferase